MAACPRPSSTVTYSRYAPFAPGVRNRSRLPFAETTAVELTSNSKHPNFQGAWLPTERTVAASGFTARWTIPFLGRNYPQAWTSPNW